MAQILIRDLDPKVVEKLKRQAARNGRSLQSELRIIFERESCVPVLDAEAGRKLAARVRRLIARSHAKGRHTGKKEADHVADPRS